MTSVGKLLVKGAKSSWRSALISPFNKLVPVGLKSLFEPISQVHAYTLGGSSNNIFIPTPETDAIVVQCYGTDLANEIKTQPSVASLTNSLRLLDFR